MPTNINDLEKTVNSSLTTSIKVSKINFNQLYIDIEIENLISSILFLKTNEKCKFKQLIDITAVDYPEKEERFKIVYLLLSHEYNLRIVINSYINEKTNVPLHYIKIRDPEKGLSCRINLDLNNNNLINLDKFKSTYKSGKSKIVEIWFQIYLNFFSKE